MKRTITVIILLLLLGSCGGHSQGTPQPPAQHTIQVKGPLAKKVLASYKKLILPSAPFWAQQVQLLDDESSTKRLAITIKLNADRSVEPLASEICEGFAETAGHGGVPTDLFLAVISADGVKMADCVTQQPTFPTPTAPVPPAPDRPEPKARPQTIIPGETITLHDRGSRSAAEVTLHDVSYPAGRDSDQPSKGKVLVELQMKIRNVGKRPVDSVHAYPAWQGNSGQYLDDTGWAYGAFGRYGDPGYHEELSGTIPPKAFIQGFSLYEVPPEPGVLIFQYGPSTMKIRVDPT